MGQHRYRASRHRRHRRRQPIRDGERPGQGPRCGHRGAAARRPRTITIKYHRGATSVPVRRRLAAGHRLDVRLRRRLSVRGSPAADVDLPGVGGIPAPIACFRCVLVGVDVRDVGHRRIEKRRENQRNHQMSYIKFKFQTAIKDTRWVVIDPNLDFLSIAQPPLDRVSQPNQNGLRLMF